jgi:hypothetical protein
LSFQASKEESGHYVYCGTDSGDIVKLVVVDNEGGGVDLLVQGSDSHINQ